MADPSTVPFADGLEGVRPVGLTVVFRFIDEIDTDGRDILYPNIRMKKSERENVSKLRHSLQDLDIARA